MDGTEALAEAIRIFDAWRPSRSSSPTELLTAHPHLAHLLAPLFGLDEDTSWIERSQAAALREPAAPEAIDSYRLTEVLGEGGMGTVWLAEQSQPVRRRVALKILKHGLGETARARFEAERQALAVMEHPSIAKIHDAGVLPDGRPWFAMEYVEGATLDEFCRDEKLGIEERLKLFVEICRGVQHAHIKGIVHRDLKPSNILVRRVDGRLAPKIIDFGVAKTVDQSLASDALQTIEGRVIGTPAYMSPEQADPSSTEIDTRSDVYALGVLLYELLTGTTPVEAKLLQRGYDEFRRVIREVDPQRPSMRITQDTTRTATVCDERGGIDVSTLTRTLRGELDWITLRALKKEPSKRYQSASAFADDLERYMHDEPVVASPPSRAYQLRKFVRRHRVPVAAGVVAILGLVVGASVAIWKAIEANENAQREQAARHRAEGHRLSALSLLTVDRDPMLALKLAIEGAKRAPGFDANNALLSALGQQNEEAVLRGHEHYVRHVEASPVEALAVSADESMLVLAWDLERKTELWRNDEHDGAISGMAFSRDGSLVATASADGTCRVFHARTGTRVQALEHPGRVTCLSFGAARLWTGCADGVVRAFDLESWNNTVSQKHHEAAVAGLVQTDRFVATVGEDQHVALSDFDRLADPPTRFALPPFAITNQNGTEEVITVSADGRLLAAKGQSKTAWLFDLKRQSRIPLDSRHDGACFDLAFSPTNRDLFLHTFSNSRKSLLDTILTTDDGLRRRDIPTQTGLGRMPVFSPDGRYLALKCRKIRIVDTRDTRTIARPIGPVQRWLDITFTHDSSRILTASSDRTVRVWRVHAMETLDRVLDGRDRRPVFFLNGDLARKYVVTYDAHAPRTDPTSLRDRRTGAVVAELLPPQPVQPRVRFSHDERWLLVLDHRRETTWLWDLQTRERVHRIPGGWTYGGFSPCGSWIWLTTYRGETMPSKLEVRDRSTNEVLLAVEDPKHTFYRAAVDPKRGLVTVTAAPQKRVGIWNVHERRFVRWIEDTTGGWTLTPYILEGKDELVVASDDALDVFRLADGKRLRTFPVRESGELIAMTPSEDRIALIGTHATILCDYESGAPIAQWSYEKPQRGGGAYLTETELTLHDKSGRSCTWPLDPLQLAKNVWVEDWSARELERYGLADAAGIARARRRERQRENTSPRIARLAIEDLENGRAQDAEATRERLERMRREDRRPAAYWLLRACLECRSPARTKADTVQRLLLRAVERGWRDLDFVTRSSLLEPLRTHPDFAQFLKRLQQAVHEH